MGCLVWFMILGCGFLAWVLAAVVLNWGSLPSIIAAALGAIVGGIWYGHRILAGKSASSLPLSAEELEHMAEYQRRKQGKRGFFD